MKKNIFSNQLLQNFVALTALISLIPASNGQTAAYPCQTDGYFTIRQADQTSYCPRVNQKCDFVLCSFYPEHGVYVRTFLLCPQETNPEIDAYEFVESSQTCVARSPPIVTTPTTPSTTPDPVPTTTPDLVPSTTPDPVPSTTPDPVPTTTPDPVPTTTPDPVPTTTPDPVPTTTPDPVPSTTPDPVPSTTPDPVPTTTPDPVPSTTEEGNPEPTEKIEQPHL